jgi:hypothetical protein
VEPIFHPLFVSSVVNAVIKSDQIDFVAETKKPIVGGFNFAFDLDFVLDLGFALDLAFDFDLDDFTFPSHDSQ